jgi:hypothetical protein
MKQDYKKLIAFTIISLTLLMLLISIGEYMVN